MKKILKIHGIIHYEAQPGTKNNERKSKEYETKDQNAIRRSICVHFDNNSDNRNSICRLQIYPIIMCEQHSGTASDG